MKQRDLTGQIFNGIKAIKLDHRDNGGRAYWVFRCHCSKHFIAQGYKVTSGHTKSCGCLFSVNHHLYAEKIRNKILANTEKTPDGCWEWKKSLGTEGYAQIVAYGGPTHGHRISYKVFKGDFDENLWVLHSCDNRKCVNPDHLFLGNGKDNYLDMIIKNRQNIAKGEKVGKAKLTEEKVLEIRKLYAEGMHGCSILAKKYKVGSAAIWCAIHGKTWKHVKEKDNA